MKSRLLLTTSLYFYQLVQDKQLPEFIQAIGTFQRWETEIINALPTLIQWLRRRHQQPNQGYQTYFLWLP